MGFEALATALSITFLAEFVDKTQLVILGLALKYKHPFHVYAGALAAHAAMDAISIGLGAAFAQFISNGHARYAIGAAFIAFGFYYLWKSNHEKHARMRKGHVFLRSFLIVSAAEFGDKTQIATGLLSAEFGDPLMVFIGAMIALAAAIGITVFVTSRIVRWRKFSLGKIDRFSSVVFIAFGILTIAAQLLAKTQS